MSTITVSDLKKNPAKPWLRLAGKDDVVITHIGQPVGVLPRIAAASEEATRALQAQSAGQQAASASGESELSMSSIDGEIVASRHAHLRK